MRALIVEDGYARGALAGVRALAAAGIEAGIASPLKGFSAYSRSCQAWHRTPTAFTDGFPTEVRRVCEEHGYEVVLPAGDVELVALSYGRDSIPALLPLPPHERVVAVVNKLDLAKSLAATGIATPPTEEATDTFLASAAYPVVLKPDVQWMPGRPPSSARLDVRIFDSAGPATERARELRAAGAAPVAQPVVEGVLVACAAVVDDRGHLQGLVAQEATHMWPPGRGISAAAVTIDPAPFRPRVEEIARATGWVGLLQAQFLRQAGALVLIDLNVRLYGSISLAVAAGVNLPALWAGSKAGTASPVVEARPGVRYQWLEGDFKRALREKSGGTLRDLAGVAARALRSTHSISSWRDPAPALVAVRMLARERREVRRG